MNSADEHNIKMIAELIERSFLLSAAKTLPNKTIYITIRGLLKYGCPARTLLSFFADNEIMEEIENENSKS